MVSYSSGFPPYYSTPQAHAIQALHAQQAAAQYAMYQQHQLTQQYQFYPEVYEQKIKPFSLVTKVTESVDNHR